MKRTFLDQMENIQKAIEDAKAANISEKLVNRLDSFLENFWGMVKVRPFTFQQLNGWPGVLWEFDGAICSVLFNPETDDWYFDARMFAPSSDQYFPGKINHITYCGRPTFYLSPGAKTDDGDTKGEACYMLPESVVDVIKLPDDFEKEYSPMLDRKSMFLLWTTNKYDGILAGYIVIDGKLYFMECVDETEFERNRMFAIYELTFFDRMITTLHVAAWSSRLTFKLAWWLSSRKQKWIQENDPQRLAIADKKKKFQATHKIIGYVKNF